MKVISKRDRQNCRNFTTASEPKPYSSWKTRKSRSSKDSCQANLKPFLRVRDLKSKRSCKKKKSWTKSTEKQVEKDAIRWSKFKSCSSTQSSNSESITENLMMILRLVSTRLQSKIPHLKIRSTRSNWLSFDHRRDKVDWPYSSKSGMLEKGQL